MAHRLSYNTLARADLLNLYQFIEERNGAAIAGGYIDRIEALCASLNIMPERGVDRSALGRGLRTVSMERRVQLVYRVNPTPWKSCGCFMPGGTSTPTTCRTEDRLAALTKERRVHD